MFLYFFTYRKCFGLIIPDVRHLFDPGGTARNGRWYVDALFFGANASALRSCGPSRGAVFPGSSLFAAPYRRPTGGRVKLPASPWRHVGD